jgi:hypothetical protein
MSITIMPDVIQGTDEWLDQRRGMVTASAIGNLVTTRKPSAVDYDCPECGAVANNPCRGKRSPELKTMHTERAQAARNDTRILFETASNDNSRGLTLALVAERITGWTEPTYISDDMLRGIEDEPRARDKYAESYAPVDEVGLIVRDDWGFQIGYSPDGLVGDDGLIEIKSRRQKKHLETILADVVPAENMAQIQCGLLVSGRAWCDYVSYCGGMPLWPKRVRPEPKWFDAIVTAVRAFEANAAEMIRIYDESTAGLPTTERVIEQEITI